MSHLVQHYDNVLEVTKTPDLLPMPSVDRGHGLQAHSPHVGSSREEESMVEVSEKVLWIPDDE